MKCPFEIFLFQILEVKRHKKLLFGYFSDLEPHLPCLRKAAKDADAGEATYNFCYDILFIFQRIPLVCRIFNVYV